MHHYNLLIPNANKSLQCLSTHPLSLHIQNNIDKLKSILSQQHYNAPPTQGEDENRTVSPFGERLANNSQVSYVRDSNSMLSEVQQKNMQQIQVSASDQQPNLSVVQQAIQHLSLLLSTAQQYIFPNKENSQPTSPKQSNNSSNHFSLQQIQSLLVNLIQDLKQFVQDQIKFINNENSSNSQCKSHPNCGSNSSSVRSLLTEKLRQIASQDFDDPQYKNDRVFQGNLMRQLSRGSKPIIVSRRFQELSETFSMQNKHYNLKQNAAKLVSKNPQRVRVQSQRTILGEINLGSSHAHEKRQKRNDVGCSRCQIF